MLSLVNFSPKAQYLKAAGLCVSVSEVLLLDIDLKKVHSICLHLFAQRKMQPWPTLITVKDRWSEIYNAQKLDLKVLEKVEDAVDWANELIMKIEAAK